MNNSNDTNTNANNQQLLNWILMSDPTIDLTAPVVPPDFAPPASNEQPPVGGADLFSYFLGNEQQQQQQQQQPPMASTYNAMPSTQAMPPRQHHASPPTTAVPPTPPAQVAPTVTQQQQPPVIAPANNSTDVTCHLDDKITSSSSSSSSNNGGACAHDQHKLDQGGGLDMSELTFDKHDDDDYLSESQLKMMTSKERRQLRNKISARKFRNRRKEYISMLENEVQKQKQENNRLRLEVTWIRGTVDKLQKENDQLRLQLVLCKEGIQPRRPTTQYIVPSSTPYPQQQQQQRQQQQQQQQHPRPSSLSPPSLGSSDPAFAPSDNSTISSHHSNPSPADYNNVDSWDLMLPTDPQQQQQQYHQTYLSHAVMPEWDLGSILRKGAAMTSASSSSDLFTTYPLLVPALMSIVLGHTMTMTTEDLVRHAKLLPAPPTSTTTTTTTHSNNELWFGPRFSTHASKKMATGQELRSIWEAQQLRKEMSLDFWDEEGPFQETEHVGQGRRRRQGNNGFPENCPLNWLQRQFCRFIYEQIIARYPQLQTPCQTYLPICDEFVQEIPV